MPTTFASIWTVSFELAIYPALACMKWCSATPIQKKNGVNTMDIAKRLIDYGFHPYTTAFPLIVPGALMIEPTESESKEECDLLHRCDEMRRAGSRGNIPRWLKSAPHNTRVRRLDEVGAARKPILRWKPSGTRRQHHRAKKRARPNAESRVNPPKRTPSLAALEACYSGA